MLSLNLNRKIKRWIKSTDVGYRLLLLKQGASWRSEKPDDGIMNKTLKNSSEWKESLEKVQNLGLIPHPDEPKNWDTLAAANEILKNTDRDARILDAGGETYSPISKWLFLYGYKNLEVLNLSFQGNFERGPIQYREGDITSSPYPDNHFQAVTCLSVIEHGIDVNEYLEEMYRILKPDGILITSTDYWENKIIVKDKVAYGQPIRIFSEGEIKSLINKAKEVGFQPTGKIDYKCEEKAVYWNRKNLEFTFIVFSLRK